jgi:hypothetical protein
VKSIYLAWYRPQYAFDFKLELLNASGELISSYEDRTKTALTGNGTTTNVSTLLTGSYGEWNIPEIQPTPTFAPLSTLSTSISSAAFVDKTLTITGEVTASDAEGATSTFKALATTKRNLSPDDVRTLITNNDFAEAVVDVGTSYIGPYQLWVYMVQSNTDNLDMNRVPAILVYDTPDAWPGASGNTDEYGNRLSYTVLTTKKRTDAGSNGLAIWDTGMLPWDVLLTEDGITSAAFYSSDVSTSDPIMKLGNIDSSVKSIYISFLTPDDAFNFKFELRDNNGTVMSEFTDETQMQTGAGDISTVATVLAAAHGKWNTPSTSDASNLSIPKVLDVNNQIVPSSAVNYAHVYLYGTDGVNEKHDALAVKTIDPANVAIVDSSVYTASNATLTTTEITGSVFDRPAQSPQQFGTLNNYSGLGKVTLLNGDEFYAPCVNVDSFIDDIGVFIDNSESVVYSGLRPSDNSASAPFFFDFYYNPSENKHINHIKLVVTKPASASLEITEIGQVANGSVVPVANASVSLPYTFTGSEDGTLEITFDPVQLKKSNPIKVRLASADNDLATMAEIQFTYQGTATPPLPHVNVTSVSEVTSNQLTITGTVFSSVANITGVKAAVFDPSFDLAAADQAALASFVNTNGTDLSLTTNVYAVGAFTDFALSTGFHSDLSAGSTTSQLVDGSSYQVVVSATDGTNVGVGRSKEVFATHWRLHVQGPYSGPNGDFTSTVTSTTSWTITELHVSSETKTLSPGTVMDFVQPSDFADVTLAWDSVSYGYSLTTQGGMDILRGVTNYGSSDRFGFQPGTNIGEDGYLNITFASPNQVNHILYASHTEGSSYMNPTSLALEYSLDGGSTWISDKSWSSSSGIPELGGYVNDVVQQPTGPAKCAVFQRSSDNSWNDGVIQAFNP